MGVFRAIIDIFQEDVFDKERFFRYPGVLVAGSKELFDGKGFGGWDDLLSQGLSGRVEGEGKVEVWEFSGHFLYRVHNPDRGDGDLMVGEAEAFDICHSSNRVHDGIVILQGLAHAHEDHLWKGGRDGGGDDATCNSIDTTL